MALRFPFAHIGSRFAENRHRSGDVNRIDLGQVGTSHAKQLRAQVELWRIPFLFLAKSFPPLLFRQTGALAPVLLLLEILLQQLITLRDLRPRASQEPIG